MLIGSRGSPWARGGMLSCDLVERPAVPAIVHRRVCTIKSSMAMLAAAATEPWTLWTGSLPQEAWASLVTAAPDPREERAKVAKAAASRAC